MDDRFLIEEALERCDGDREFLSELMDMFFQELPTSLSGLRESLESEDCDGVFKQAHALKSSLGNLGAGRAFKTAKELEVAGKGKNLEDCQRLFHKLESDIEEFSLAVKEMLAV